MGTTRDCQDWTGRAQRTNDGFNAAKIYASRAVLGHGLGSGWSRSLESCGTGCGPRSHFICAHCRRHVAGNAIGSRLRQRGTQHSIADLREGPTGEGLGLPSGRRRIQPHQFAPVTRLSRRTSLGWFPVVVTVLGGIAGAIGGGVTLQRTNPAAATVSTMSLGCLASGVLAAFWTFWMFSLLQVFLGAWWQAHRHGQRR